MKWIFLTFLIFNQYVFAEPVKITQVKMIPLKEAIMPGFEFDTDQSFRISTGSLKDKYIFFASSKRGSGADLKPPRFVLSDDSKILDFAEISKLDEGLNLVAVQAVSASGPVSKSNGARILAIVTFEPWSGRESDYFELPFVFDISNDGKIEANQALNKKMASQKKRPKTIKEIRNFLKSNY